MAENMEIHQSELLKSLEEGGHSKLVQEALEHKPVDWSTVGYATAGVAAITATALIAHNFSSIMSLARGKGFAEFVSGSASELAGSAEIRPVGNFALPAVARPETENLPKLSFYTLGAEGDNPFAAHSLGVSTVSPEAAKAGQAVEHFTLNRVGSGSIQESLAAIDLTLASMKKFNSDLALDNVRRIDAGSIFRSQRPDVVNFLERQSTKPWSNEDRGFLLQARRAEQATHAPTEAELKHLIEATSKHFGF